MIPPLLMMMMMMMMMMISLLSLPINVLPAESPPIAKPNCPTSCGDVSIPFPFGIGTGCYHDHWYAVNCSSSNKPILGRINLEVLNISLEENTVLVNHPVFNICGMKYSDRTVRNESVNLEGTPFFFSSANRFVGVGCNTFALMWSNNGSIINGCMAVCDQNNITVESGGCYGIKCCQTRIPSSLFLQVFNASLRFIDFEKERPTECRSGFLVEEKWPEKNIGISGSVRDLVPVVLDWGVNNFTFEMNSAKRYNTTVGCESFAISSSTLFRNNPSYDESFSVQKCTCKRGYEGNPYLLQGCQESPAIEKPNCPTICGEVSIPFPFGIGAGCYLDDRYAVNCSSSNKPILGRINLEVLNISLEENTVLVNHPVFNICGMKYFNESVRNESVNLEGTPFFFSSANRFVGVGCNTYSRMRSNDSIINGCLAVCDEKNITAESGGCYGIKCCQTRIPSSLYLQVFNASLSIIKEEKEGQTDCKSAFLVEDKWLEENIDIPGRVRDLTNVPVVLDWVIHLFRNNTTFCNRNCTPIRNYNTSYDESFPVHKCTCTLGYEGNPYQGCQDIDECEVYYPCRSNMKCINTYGGFDCVPSVLPTKSIVMIGLCTGLGALIFLVGVWWLYIIIKKRKKIKLKEKYFKRNGGLLLQQQLTSFDGSVDKGKFFDSKELDKATDHFNVNRILGHGGQGTVYKGMLTDGRIVAVKKSKVVDEAKLEEFINEVAILSQINHRNVVKLLGCCLETEVPLLVYEFIPNGTLFQYLHDRSEELPLTWEMRLQIATEVAGALSYLHSAASSPIYHRDIKSANILLDDKYRAKVADFGTSKSIAIDQTHVTTKVQGTFGYLDPEFFQSSQFTDKSDVYSFAVVLVELLTGQKAISSTKPQDNKSLATHFILSMVENNLFDILDPEVIKLGKKEDIITVGNLAKRCLNLNGKKRPTMKEVVMVLEGIQASQKQISKFQQNYEEVEYMRTEVIEPWDAVSTLTSSTFEITAPLNDIQPLLTK